MTFSRGTGRASLTNAAMRSDMSLVLLIADIHASVCIARGSHDGRTVAHIAVYEVLERVTRELLNIAQSRANDVE